MELHYIFKLDFTYITRLINYLFISKLTPALFGIATFTCIFECFL